MFSSNATFIGIDPTAGEKPIVYAAIDHTRHLLALGAGSLDDVLAFAAGQHQAVLAVCGPRRPNRGMMKDPQKRGELTPQPAPGRWENHRLAEYLLRQHNLFIPPTPSEEEACPNWMRQSFLLFRRLEEMGYQDFLEETAERRSLEVYPHASYSTLLGVLPFPKRSLEGRIQRQLVLFENEMEVLDPMDFFEEITRHRLLKGVLPFDGLYTPGELDALVAAFTALHATSRPDQTIRLGDPEEGQIVLPVQNLKTRY